MYPCTLQPANIFQTYRYAIKLGFPSTSEHCFSDRRFLELIQTVIGSAKQGLLREDAEPGLLQKCRKTSHVLKERRNPVSDGCLHLQNTQNTCKPGEGNWHGEDSSGQSPFLFQVVPQRVSCIREGCTSCLRPRTSDVSAVHLHSPAVWSTSGLTRIQEGTFLYTLFDLRITHNEWTHSRLLFFIFEGLEPSARPWLKRQVHEQQLGTGRSPDKPS